MAPGPKSKAAGSAAPRQNPHLKLLRSAVRKMRSLDSALRPPASDGRPGGLVEFPKTERREFIIIGDLHGNHRNLQAILKDSDNLEKVRADRAVLLFLGDAVHNDRPGHAYEMESSIRTMDLILDLINECPDNVIYLLGNHDTFDAHLSKHGIQQGLLYRQALKDQRGADYVDAMQEFFDALPLFVIHKSFLATHAGPVRGGITRNELINARHFENVVWQLTWNRLNEIRSTPSMKEYGPEDLDETRRLLGCPERTPFIVGHNPMWKWGDADSIWINPAGAHDHVILYATLEKICPYLSIRNSSPYEVKYADLELKPRRYVMDDY